MNKSKKERTEKERAAHHRALEQLAESLNPGNERSGLLLWRALRRVEVEVTRYTTGYCSAECSDTVCDKACERAMREVANILGGNPPGFLINRDPRGYALKLESGSVPFALHTDWGKYQILAPMIK